MITHARIPLDDPSRWRNALEGIPHAFAHTWEHCYGMHLSSYLPTFLYSFEAENTRIVCPFSERSYGRHIDLVTPYGFSGFAGSGAYPGFPSFWRGFAQEQGYVCGYIGLHPLFGNDSYYDPADLFEHNVVYVLDLTLSSEELFARLSENRKRQLRHWEKLVPLLVHEQPEVKSFFLDHYHDFFRRKQAASVYHFSPETLSWLLDQTNVFIAGAREAGRIVAVSVFSHTADAGEYLFNVSVPEGRPYAALLLWHGMHHLKHLGIPRLHLGGGIRRGDGVATFKQRFGSQALPQQCLKQVYNPQLYEQLCRRARVDPANRTGYFPPYRKP